MSDDVDVSETIAACLRELTETSQEPIPGAKFKAFLLRRFENSDHPVRQALSKERFGSLLQSMPDKIALKHEFGSDLLAAPKGKEYLFFKRKVEKGSAIRQDLFRAFSQFGSAQQPFYDRNTDRVTSLDLRPEDTTRFVEIPPRTVEAEIELRRQFAASLADAVLSAKLFADLNAPQRELANFSGTVRSSGCLRDWLAFKNRNILERMRDWASVNGVQWNESWIETPAGAHAQSTVQHGSGDDQSSLTLGLVNALGQLSDEDLRRISVPLDIVIRLLNEK
jgi:hypothetical protein